MYLVVKGIRQEALDLGLVTFSARQKGVPVILRELRLLNSLSHVLPSFEKRIIKTRHRSVISD